MLRTPQLQIRNKSVLIYDQWESTGPKQKSLIRIQNMTTQQKTAYSGNITKGARKRLTKAITLLVKCSKKRVIYNEVTKRHQPFQLAFVTLTVSDPEKKLSGKEAYKKLFSHFLAWMRRTKKINTYIWKAELQKNGQIHYHITTPSFINYQEIRDKWNNLQRKAGLLDKYAEKKGHYDANSTDVHSVKNIRDLSSYLIKYIAKETQNKEKLGGKIWDCSNNLSKTKYHTIPLTADHENFIQQAEENNLCMVFRDDRYSIAKFMQHPEEYILSEREYKNYNEFLQKIGETIEYHDPDRPTKRLSKTT